MRTIVLPNAMLYASSAQFFQFLQITARNASIEKLILSVSGKIEDLLYGENVPPQAGSQLLKLGHHLGGTERRTIRLHTNRMR